MLVLSRHENESIIIGDDIKITVIDIRGDKVRLGISAPTNVPVHRQEVYETIQRENVQTPTPVSQTGGQAAKIEPGPGLEPEPEKKL